VDLRGNLVRLRELRPEDAPALAANAADPEVARHLDTWAWGPYSVRRALDFISRADPAAVDWAVESLEDGAVLGTTGVRHIDHRHRHCWWGIALGPPSRWDRGYGSEACRLSVRFAFRQLGMEKVYLFVDEGNDRARRAYEKAGFKLEGTLPRHHWRDGGLVTAHLMAAYRDDPLYSG
jgi:RimJ/RimL family protein N-acetyltransferase